jgi:uncharacterized protein (DUF2336 family)
MSHAQPLLAELETALNGGVGLQRFEILRRITDLFLANAPAYSEVQVTVFDDVIDALIAKIEHDALVELSGRLAPIVNAPIKVVTQLSRHDDIAVSGPMLEQSSALPDNVLADIARTKSQAHLAAIAGRARINAVITDILVDRGNLEVARKVTSNTGAGFSRFGHAKLAIRAEQDEQLAIALTKRTDLPPEMFDQLVRKATALVQQKMLTNAEPAMRDRIERTLTTVSQRVAHAERPRSRPSSGGPRVAAKHDVSQIRAQVSQAASASKSAETIDALALLSGVPVRAVKHIVQQRADDGIIILGKAGGLGWPDLKNVLNTTMPEKLKKPEDAKALFEKFVSLSGENAQRVLRFIKTSEAASLADIRKMM